jgi:Na+-driven multidrug efflux pump
LVIYAWTLRDHARLGIRRAPQGAARGNGAQQRRLGYGAAATAAIMNLLGMCMTVFSGWLGTLPLAAMTALWNALSVGALLAFGIADATALRVAATQGDRARGTSMAAALLGLGVTMLALAVLVVPVFLAPAGLAGFYAPDANLRAMLITLLPLGGLVLLCDGAGFVCGAALRGLGDVVCPTGIQVAIAAALVPLAWWFAIARGGGPAGLVAAILITSVLRVALLAARFWWCAGNTALHGPVSLPVHAP